jgi:(E)-4-hydroxy-3-methylbut-2-enyl-diphosphate synthase
MKYRGEALVDSVATGVSPANSRRSDVSDQRSEISFDPFSISGARRRSWSAKACKSAATNLCALSFASEQHEKIAHKIDKMGDYKPEIVFENADVIELDPRDDEAIARVNDSAKTELVTVMDGIDLPMIAAFRLLARSCSRGIRFC